MIFEKLHEDNWHNCKWNYPHPNAFFFSQITSKIAKQHKFILIKDSHKNLSKEMLSHPGKNFFFPYSEEALTKHPQNSYYYIQKTPALNQEQMRGGVFIFSRNDQINSFELFNERYMSILEDKYYDKTIKPHLYINSHLVKDPLEQIHETQVFLENFEKQFGHFEFIDHIAPWLWEIDYPNYKIFDLGSDQTVYYNTMFLHFLAKNGDTDGFFEIKDLKIKNRPDKCILKNQTASYEVILMPSELMAKRLKPIEYQVLP